MVSAVVLATVMASSFTLPPPPPPPRRGDASRRELLSVASGCLAIGFSSVPGRAGARVDGIPLYAPSGSAPLPEQGFETLLPRLEQLIADVRARRAAAANEADWSGVVALRSESAVAAQASLLGSLAGILGDDAYTVLGLKKRYLSAVQTLAIAADVRGPPEVELGKLDEMVAILVDVKQLIPQEVVAQVRALEARKRELGIIS